MIRSAARLAVGLAAALALTLTGVEVAAPSSAAIRPVASPSKATAPRDCSTQQAAYDAAVAHRDTTATKLQTAKHRVTLAKRRLRHAVAAHQTAKVHRLTRKVRKLKRQARRLTHRLELARAQTGAAALALATCQNSGGGGTSSPIQNMCDAGLPEQLCDTLGGLAGGDATTSLQQLCDAVPQLQPLCTAAASGLPTDPAALTDLLQPLLDALGLGGLLGGGGGPLPSDLTSVQALCDAGLPQTVCDSLAGLAGGVPGGLTLTQLCSAVPGAQAICDAANIGAGLPTNLTGLTDLLGPVLDTLGLGGLLGGGGGPLPSDLTSVQALCDAGLPQLVCTTLAAQAGSLQPSALSLTDLCTAVAETQPVCDAANSPAGLPTGSALTDLLRPVLDVLGLGGLLGLLGL